MKFTKIKEILNRHIDFADNTFNSDELRQVLEFIKSIEKDIKDNAENDYRVAIEKLQSVGGLK